MSARGKKKTERIHKKSCIYFVKLTKVICFNSLLVLKNGANVQLDIFSQQTALSWIQSVKLRANSFYDRVKALGKSAEGAIIQLFSKDKSATWKTTKILLADEWILMNGRAVLCLELFIHFLQTD